MMGKMDLFTQFYPTGFTQWVNLTVPTLILTFSIFLSLLSSPCVSSVARLSVFGVDRVLSASVSIDDDDDGSTLPIAFNRSSTVIYDQPHDNH